MLYHNIGPNIIGFWFSDDPTLEDISVLRNRKLYSSLQEALKVWINGLCGDARNTRGLCEVKKATEWKHFFTKTSVSTLHGILPETLMDGWWCFVQLCEILNR